MYKTDTEFPGVGCRALASHQQLPGSTRNTRTGLGTGQGMDSGMHGSESGSESQVEQQAGFQKAAMDEESETLVIPQLETEYNVHGMNT